MPLLRRSPAPVPVYVGADELLVGARACAAAGGEVDLRPLHGARCRALASFPSRSRPPRSHGGWSFVPSAGVGGDHRRYAFVGSCGRLWRPRDDGDARYSLMRFADPLEETRIYPATTICPRPTSTIGHERERPTLTRAVPAKLLSPRWCVSAFALAAQSGLVQGGAAYTAPCQRHQP